MKHLLLLALASAQRQGVPHGGAPCDPSLDGWDCSLGGTCNASSQCACDIQFTGPSCALFNLQAPVDDQAGTCGASFEGYHSWGGRPIFTAEDNKWHSSISFLCHHKNLDSWTTASASAHFVADSPAGAYAWGPEQCPGGEVCTPSVIPWSHNTVFLEDPASEPMGARFQIWHVGDGIAPAADWAPCFNYSEVGRARAPRPASNAWPRSSAPSPGNAAYVAVSNSPAGPWTRALGNGQVPINFTGAWTTALAGNPAPLLMPDGSYNLYFTAVPCPPNSGAKAPNCIAMATSTSGYLGPYQMHAAKRPITFPESEDPSVFRDRRGNYHLISNINTFHARCAEGVECGGHAWSRDGATFSNLTIGAFGPAITFKNGSVWLNSYVERPLVSTAPDGTPVALHLGMGRHGYSDCCNWPQLFCTGAQGEVCGPTLTPPPPPPPPPRRLRNGGLCLTFNASAFPCSGSSSYEGCPLVLGDCAAPGAAWALQGDGTIASAAVPGVGLSVDCNAQRPHTLVKALVHGNSPLAFDAARGVVAFGGSGLCLNTGQGPAVPPCGPPGELWLQTQVQLAPCADASAAGWSVE